MNRFVKIKRDDAIFPRVLYTVEGFPKCRECAIMASAIFV